MTISKDRSIPEIVSKPAQLDSAAASISQSPAIALDTESNSFYHYPEQLCLIQIATSDKAYVIDTIALPGISVLRDTLANGSVVKVIHGADYDLRSLDRHCRYNVRNIFDTSIAARFVGIQHFGLADSLKEVLGVTIAKNKRLQLMDWGRRPLSAESLEYAVADVAHLLELRRRLSERLTSLSRMAWVHEEFARLETIRYSEPDTNAAVLGVKGSRDLDERGLAVLRSLYLFREKEAVRQHRPPFFILPDAALVWLAGNPMSRPQDIPGLGEVALQRYGRGIDEAIRQGLKSPPLHRPANHFERPSREQIDRLSQLKTWRKSMGESLSLDPSLLWPAASLERLAASPHSLELEMGSVDVRRWQREQLGASLRAYLGKLAKPK